jgi:hypothetical protein
MPKARDLEKAMSDITVTNPYSNQQQKLFVAMADPVEEQLLHMVTADPQRTPTFTPFAQGDYFLSASSTTPCPGNDPNACLTTAVTNPNSSFAWNHGGVQPEIRTTWIGWGGRESRRSIRPTRSGPTTPISARPCSRCSG